MSTRQTISLVAWREIRERLRSRVFLYSTLLMLVVVGAASALPAFIDTTKTYQSRSSRRRRRARRRTAARGQAVRRQGQAPGASRGSRHASS